MNIEIDIHTVKNTIEKQAFRNGFSQIENSSFLHSLEEQPYFIFSPYLLFEDSFKHPITNPKKGYVTQVTFRSNGSYENFRYFPLVTNLNLIFSLFSSQYLTYDEVIRCFDSLIISNFNLNKDNIYWRVPSTNLSLINSLKGNNVIPWPDVHLDHPIPGIQEKCTLVKIEYHYNDGLIPIANLVFIGDKNGKCKLDSVVYLERLLFILNNSASVLDTPYYNSIMVVLKKGLPTASIEDIRYMSLLLRTSLILLLEGILPQSRKAGYFTRKYLRDFFKLYLATQHNNNLMLMVEEILLSISSISYDENIAVNKGKLLNVFQQEFMNYSDMIRKNINLVTKKFKGREKLEPEEIEKISSTYGVPLELISSQLNLPISIHSKPNLHELGYTYEDIKRDFSPVQWYQDQLDRNIQFDFTKKEYIEPAK
ncbi:alanine--tRNA ligase-related protein [Bacillus infantis]|uniref:alanine--tRNA ligase-related protein n=1 Tax=Bacillus infantis TaxID=324767 RepID=UPI00209E0C1F|nr:alanine--tRNA ligase-related protein [Bacillus infantis]MCP1161321.1 alanine--tRNA ligase-related protein [Bacillus infantis]